MHFEVDSLVFQSLNAAFLVFQALQADLVMQTDPDTLNWRGESGFDLTPLKR